MSSNPESPSIFTIIRQCKPEARTQYHGCDGLEMNDLPQLPSHNDNREKYREIRPLERFETLEKE